MSNDDSDEQLNLYTTLYLRVSGLRRMSNGMADLELRRYFQKEVLEMEMKSHERAYREIPQLEPIRNELIQKYAKDVWEGYEELFVRKGRNYGENGVADRMRLLFTPASDCFHCFHCGSNDNTTPPPERRCSRCGGWYMLEMDPTNIMDVPQPPPHFRLLKRRLIPDQRPPISEDAFAQVVIEMEDIACSICHDDFEIGSPVMRLQCGHNFHHGCPGQWLTQHRSCPLCRRVVPTVDNLFNIYLRAQHVISMSR